MRALLLLTLAFSCILKNSYCISYEDLINNKEAMDLVKENYDFRTNELRGQKKLLKKLKKLKLEMGKSTLQKYVKKMREDGGGTPNFQALASASGNPGSSIPYEAAGGGTPNFEALAGNPGSSIPNDARAAGGGTPNFEALASGNLVQNAKKAIEEETNKFLAGARQKLYERQYKLVMQSVPGFDATPYLPQSQSTRWTGAPNFSKAPGSSSHQQAPPTDDTFVPLPSQAGTDSTNWFGDDGSLYSVVNPKNPSSWKNAWGAVSNLLGASPQEPQFSPSMHDTPAASSYYSSNQPDDGSLQSLITPRNQKDAPPFLQAPQIGRQSSNFTSGNPGAWNRGKSTNFSKAPNSGNWSFSSITGFGATAHLPNQSPSTGWLNFSKPAPSFPQTTQIGRQSSNFTSGNPGSSEKGKSTIFSKGSNPDNWPRFSITGFDTTPFLPNQSQSTRRTGAVPSQPGTPSLDGSGGNSHNDEGTLASVVRPKNPSSSKGKSTSKSGKKPRN